MDLFERRGLNHALWLWETSWPPIQDEIDAFNFRHGPDPNNHSDVESSELLDVIGKYWGRNTIRPSVVSTPTTFLPIVTTTASAKAEPLPLGKAIYRASRIRDIGSLRSVDALVNSYPDLVVPFMKGEYENWNGRCIVPGQRYGLEVWVENIGEADAGPFVVEANEVQQTLEPGLVAGERRSMWFPRYIHWEPNHAFADATFLIEEGNEDNNELSQQLPVPTPPLTCTPTPTWIFFPVVWKQSALP
jgi:hypothetical protein